MCGECDTLAFMKTDSRSYILPIVLTPAQKRDRVRRIKDLNAALELGRKGIARPINLAKFLKEARKRYPGLVK